MLQVLYAPLGAFAELAGGVVRLRAVAARLDGSVLLRVDRSGSSPEAVFKRIGGG